MMGGNKFSVTPGVNQDANDIAGGPATENVGAITSGSGNTCSLGVDGLVITVSLNDVRPVMPEKQDTVVILSGDEAGTKGSLLGREAFAHSQFKEQRLYLSTLLLCKLLTVGR
ncbi:hypothetical protein KXD40_001450 [Peronospora effusa]|uniref:Uncharacterized protein n=1 Tax=Peronospora effusa TaxID=542832 RepID=A0A3M6V6Z3_9STRA|nr:hypothetical protein DD238_007636 [Peronospora effusa]UIZ20734.1 hypothetical protein KXD40_001450 [Peronospora effusa]CAI5704530.1 unnamed protein product [Peronospora effusa]